MEVCKESLDGKRHTSEHSSCSVPEYNDLEAAEALVCMSFWRQMSPKPNAFKPRPLTPASDSCDSVLQPEPPETPKDFVSLSSLVSQYSYSEQLGSKICTCKAVIQFVINIQTGRTSRFSGVACISTKLLSESDLFAEKTWGGFYDSVDSWQS